MDIVFIKELTVMAVIGVHEWEQQRLQKLVIDLELGTDNLTAAAKNSIASCVNYTDISKSILSLMSSTNFVLIESVAEEIANILIAKFGIPWMRVKVSKIGAVPQASSVGVIIERIRST